jgi:hypothetical protein
MRDNSGHGRFFTSSDSTARDAAVAAAVGFAGIAVCEIALAVGAPFGSRGLGQRPRSPLDRAAGRERSRRGCRAAAALIVLGRAGMWSVGKRTRLFRWERGSSVV